MSKSEKADDHSSPFNLDKWFLDFTGENGETMIFYSAVLIWHGIRIPYTAWVHCSSSGIVNQKSSFLRANLPVKSGKEILWSDEKYRVKGKWIMDSKPVGERIFESEDGMLQWNCHQPVSDVQLKIGGKSFFGNGYAEQLILSVPVWKIPMDELRWGRIAVKDYQVVWIEIKERGNSKKWLWLNGEKTADCKINDHLIEIPGKDLSITFDKGTVLEAEKKLKNIAEQIIRYIPGMNKIIPMKYLMADEVKWLSKAEIRKGGRTVRIAPAIHEFVSFYLPGG